MTEFIMTQIQNHTAAGLFCLVAVFFYIGLITIGGGQVGITIIQQIAVENLKLLSDEKFFNMVAISESTPGPIGINLATYVGTELYGIFGGIITTFGQVLPSLIVIMLIARYFGKFSEKKRRPGRFFHIAPCCFWRNCCCGGKNSYSRPYYCYFGFCSVGYFNLAERNYNQCG